LYLRSYSWYKIKLIIIKHQRKHGDDGNALQHFSECFAAFSFQGFAALFGIFGMATSIANLRYPPKNKFFAG
jgi:hypothetical protein